MLKVSRYRWLFALTFVLLVNPSYALALKPFETTYKTSYELGFTLNIEAKRTLKKMSNGDWLLDFRAKNWFARVQQTSTLTLVPDSLPQPLSYHYYRSIFGKTEEEKITFNWEKGETYNQLNADTWQMLVPQETQDLLSFQLTLRYDLLKNPEQKHFSYPVIDKKKIKTLDFRVVGEEVLQTPMGQLNAIKVESMHHSDREAVNHLIWLAKDWDNLVLRVDPVRRKHKQEPVYLIKGSLNGQKIQGL